jgi:hypothetical protein
VLRQLHPGAAVLLSCSSLQINLISSKNAIVVPRDALVKFEQIQQHAKGMSGKLRGEESWAAT